MFHLYYCILINFNLNSLAKVTINCRIAGLACMSAPLGYSELLFSIYQLPIGAMHMLTLTLCHGVSVIWYLAISLALTNIILVDKS